MFNQAIIFGRLGADPELRNTNNGNAVASLRVATSHRRKVGEQWEEVTTWHGVKVWGRSAENCAKYLTKGSQVQVVGRMEHGEYTNKEGQTVRTFEIIADRVIFAAGSGDSQSRPASKPKSRNSYTPPAPVDDDIPF